MATLAWIRREQFDDAEDLMHKASGWLLRELGKRDELTLTDFLDCHARRMPRTMLRYAIERLSAPQKRAYLAVKRERHWATSPKLRDKTSVAAERRKL